MPQYEFHAESDQRSQQFTIQANLKGSPVLREDSVAIEEPLEIQVAIGDRELLTVHSVAVTMRTPGNDIELALGFLLTEGVISGSEDLVSAAHVEESDGLCNVVRVVLSEEAGERFDAASLSRHVFTSSSCGICGKQTIDRIRADVAQLPVQTQPVSLPLLSELPLRLRKAQPVFELTGGLHASALFDLQGELISSREDVGRHNALDKLIGHRLRLNALPANDQILLLSGRISFELVQKAVLAGIPTIAAVGAPSSLAISLAREFQVNLIGFLRDNRYNIYHQNENAFTAGAVF